MVQRRRVVITGLGVLAPNGCGKETFWQACLQGHSGIRAITSFDASPLPTRIAGEVPDFAPHMFGLTPAECEHLDRGTQFAVAAANLALDDAQLQPAHLDRAARLRFGVYLGTAMASVNEGERLWRQLTNDGAHPPRAIFKGNELSRLMHSYVPSATIAGHHCLAGPCQTLVTGCSAGADAIGLAFRAIQEGHADQMLAGGSDSAISLLGLNVFCVMRALSTRNDEPEQASRPYDAHRDGFVLSEGSAMLLLEERENALARGAHVYAEILAFASNSNAHHMTALPEDGAPLQTILRQTLEEAHLSHDQLGYINSHGSSTPPNEAAETAAYKGVFGTQAYSIPISATKSLIGHTQGAASAIETLVTALAIDQQILPPTINQEERDPACDLDYIPNTARPVDPHNPLRFALTHSSGFGGVNSALLLARHTGESPPVPTVHLSHQTAISRSSRRVVVTGLGVIAPSGSGKTGFWSALQTNHSGIRALPKQQEAEFPRQYAGAVDDFCVEDYIDRKMANRTDRMTHFILAAVQEALDDTALNLEKIDPKRIGTVIANTLGGIEYVAKQIETLYTRGPRAMSAYTAIAWLPVANAGQIALRYGLQGYCKALANDTCGGLSALGMAHEAIARGEADIIIAGGCEAPLQPGALQVLGSDGHFCLPDNPYAYRPFDRRASGLVIAEAAGVCILEDFEHAQRRSAPIYGEIVGYAQANDPSCAIAAPVLPDATIYAHVLRQTLSMAHIKPQDIACLYIDGRALPAWDASEVLALRTVFGSALDQLPCSVPRTQSGHSLSAAGVLDTISALLGLQHGLIPATLNCEEPDLHHSPPELVRAEPRPQQSQTNAALICGRGFNGSHATLAVRKV